MESLIEVINDSVNAKIDFENQMAQNASDFKEISKIIADGMKKMNLSDINITLKYSGKIGLSQKEGLTIGFNTDYFDKTAKQEIIEVVKSFFKSKGDFYKTALKEYHK